MREFDADDIELILQMAQEITGAKIHRTHDSVLVQNIRTRVIRNGCHSLEEYLRYLDRTPSEEPHFISALTIHTTSFFREMVAFEQFNKHLEARIATRPQDTFNLLSIGSSTGEELYSFGLVLESFRRRCPGFDYRLEAWDIDPVSLSSVSEGQYPDKVMGSIPLLYKNLMEKVPDRARTWTPIRDIRTRVHTRCRNILEISTQIEKFDFIACRNLLIYFDQAKIDKAISHIINLLTEKGVLCTGVSEAVAVRHEQLRSLSMPFFTVRSAVASPTVSKDAISNTTKSRRSHKSIALLEEGRNPKEQLGVLLRDAGYEVLSTRSPQDICDAITHSRNIGLIILQNILLTGRSPLDYIKKLRELGYKDAICLMANQSDSSLAEKAIAVGCTEILVKPIRTDEVLARCKHYLGLPLKKSYFYPDLILIGASTGGTELLVKMLANLPSPCPPLLVVQHISPNFAQDYAQRLAKTSGLTLGNIRNGEKLMPGHLYMALHDYHIRVTRQDGTLRLDLNLGPHRNNHRPSVDVLFESALTTRTKIVACLMTGMGADGAQGLLKLRNQGALTFAQDEASSVVFGMPREAIRLDAVDYVCNPEEMRRHIDEILCKTMRKRNVSNAS